jgi:hypothetical protein
MHLTVTVNSPGEVSGWLLPLAAALKAIDPRGRLTAVVTPCAFAGGLERVVLRESPVVDEVIDLGPHLRSLLRHPAAARRAARSAPAIVLHLGGDRVYSLLLSRLLGAPAWAYGTSAARWRRFARLLVPDDRSRARLVARGVPDERIAVIGQFVVDSVPADLDAGGALRSIGLDPARDRVVSLLPGSRPYELDFMLPFFAGVIDDLAARAPAVRCVMPWSGFVPRADVDRALAGSGARWEDRDGGATFVTPSGARAPIVDARRYAVMQASSVAVSLPGTNTLQLAALGVPTIVVVPLNRAETIVVGGPLNWLSPRWGPTRALKRSVLFRLNARLKYVALPNIIADERIVPEMRAVLSPADVSQAVAALVEDANARSRMAARLVEIAGPRGAARKAAALLVAHGAPMCASTS